MDAAYVLLAVVIALIGVVAKIIHGIHKKCHETSEGLIAVETKMDIYLEIAGLDVQKVNRAIKEHKDELKQNGKPSVGCINIKELYRDKES
jgi:hypothetical protein